MYKYLLTFYVPTTHTETCKAAVFKAGAGIWPGELYSEACFTIRGAGQFRPGANANPNIGAVGELERLEEDKVEMVCMGKECAQKAAKALIEAHPYEVVAYFMVKSEDF